MLDGVYRSTEGVPESHAVSAPKLQALLLPLPLTAVVFVAFALWPDARAQAAEANPFGIASGAQWSGDYPKFEPVLRDAGVGWLRYFDEWGGIQPKRGEWNWKWADEFVAASKTNGLQVAGVFLYFAPWASSGGDSRTFPVRDMQYWRDYVGSAVTRYQKDIRYWEVWNEPQSFQKNGTPQHYADMVRAAYDTAKKIDSQVKLGLTTANFAVAYLDMVLKAGAKDHFDYLCVHPYENMKQLTRPGGEVTFLSMAGSLRRLLAAHRQRADLPLWITEIGWQAPIKPHSEKEAQQAQLLVKTYVLSLAQGFEKVFWFEARGPAYGKGTDHGLIRTDWTPRPALAAMKTMTTALGDAPRHAGWLDWNGSYAFLFENGKAPVLAAWSPVGKEVKVTFTGAVSVTEMAGKETKLPAGQEWTLTNLPVFATGVPADLVQEAKANRAKPFPWGGDFTAAQELSYRWGQESAVHGLEPTGEVTVEKTGGASYARVNKGGGLSFRANPGFAPFGTTHLEIKVIARRAVSGKKAGLQLMYETLKTIHGYDRAGWWTIPEGDGWQEHTWRVTDANFVGTWAYNLALTEISGDLLLKEVSVKKTNRPR